MPENCLENNKVILRSQQRFRSELDNAFIEKDKKIAVGANNDKRIQTTDGVIIYLLGYALDDCVQNRTNERPKNKKK